MWYNSTFEAMAQADGAAAVQLMSPVIQYGFAGFAVVLLAVLVWLVGRLLHVMERQTSATVELNIRMMQMLGKMTEQEEALREMTQEMIRRPCLHDQAAMRWAGNK